MTAKKKPISSKQEIFLRAKDKRINLLSGSVRSGKTWISLLKWAIFVGGMPESYEFIMCGKTVTALKRNCLNLMIELVGANNFTYSLSQKSGVLFGRRVWLEGANDERSESKIRGMTLGGAYCDELTLFPQGFYNMLLSRLSLPGAKLYATTNPDAPTHWVKQDIIDNQKIDTALWNFLLTDNDFLDPEWVENIKREFVGVFYDRYILGRWVRAEGIIYPMFDEKKHTLDTSKMTFDRYYVSCDYGTLNPMSMGLWGRNSGKWYRVKEYYYDGRKNQRQFTDEEYYSKLVELVGDRRITSVIIDPSAASFIACIRKHGKYLVRPALNAVIDGIRNTATAVEKGLILFDKTCKATIAEFYSYVWDEKAKEDKPIKENDHTMDDIRYFVHTILFNGGGKFINVRSH